MRINELGRLVALVELDVLICDELVDRVVVLVMVRSSVTVLSTKLVSVTVGPVTRKMSVFVTVIVTGSAGPDKGIASVLSAVVIVRMSGLIDVKPVVGHIVWLYVKVVDTVLRDSVLVVVTVFRETVVFLVTCCKH